MTRVAFILLGIGLVVLATTSGCDRGEPKDQLGSVIFEVPEVPGCDQPYEMPKLGPPPEHSSDRPELP
jgi:hypothetical protein